MGVFTYEFETTTIIPPARLFKAFALDGDNLIPNVAPLAIESSEIIEGNGGPGTIKMINLGQRSQYNYAKLRIDEMDNANFTYGYSLIEGDALTRRPEKISYKFKLGAYPEGGSILKSICKYHTKGDLEIKEEEIKASKENIARLFKAVEAYLLVNPEAITK
ncbi:major allergen Pru ar 1-like [Castanea sativa]|uniref:major allergen Pru ar 1-like n=1 Tax=Castanea sativa TaxID=21020 RepID=UPI003F652632